MPWLSASGTFGQAVVLAMPPANLMRHEMPAPPGLRILRPFSVGELVERRLGRVPVLIAEIDPRTEHLRLELGLELLVDVLAGLAVGRLVRDLDRHAVEVRQLDHVAVGHQAGQHPGAGRGHLDLALQQRLGDVEVGEQLAGVEHLARRARPSTPCRPWPTKSTIATLRGWLGAVSSEQRNLSGSAARSTAGEASMTVAAPAKARRVRRMVIDEFLPIQSRPVPAVRASLCHRAGRSNGWLRTGRNCRREFD